MPEPTLCPDCPMCSMTDDEAVSHIEQKVSSSLAARTHGATSRHDESWKFTIFLPTLKDTDYADDNFEEEDDFTISFADWYSWGIPTSYTSHDQNADASRSCTPFSDQSSETIRQIPRTSESLPLGNAALPSILVTLFDDPGSSSPGEDEVDEPDMGQNDNAENDIGRKDGNRTRDESEMSTNTQ